MPLKPWTVIDRQPIFQSARANVFNETVKLPDGRIIDDYLQIEMAQHAVIMARDAQARWLVQRQYKHGPRAVSLTFPAGHLNPGETPIEAAKRELLEETGYGCATWRPAGSYVLNGNQGAGCAHMFLAENMERQTTFLDHDEKDLEEQEILWLTTQQLVASFRDGQFKIISHALAFTLALNPELWS